MARHGITDIEDPYNKNFKPATQPADRRNYSASWGPPMDSEPKKKRANIYYDPWTAPPEPEEVIYVVPYERRRKEPEYKSTGKFPKLDEAIAAAKKFKK